MANPEHLALLKRGVEAWNEWRERHPDVLPELSGAVLDGAALGGAKLRRARLRQAKLRQAALNKADLREAYLRGAILSGGSLREAHLGAADLLGAELVEANLLGANLRRGDLTGATLCEAILREADLRGANLSGANLTGADLSEAHVYLTVFARVNLSACRGLDTLVHGGPSTIGLDTFFLSEGKIPEVFLRGCGVPDIFLQYAAALAGTAIAFYTAFISYSSKDEELAQRLYADLQAKGVRCWFAPEDLKIGDLFSTEIDQAIQLHDRLLLLLSTNSMESAWVEHEVRTALERERKQGQPVLFPIRLDDAVMGTTQQWAYDLRRQRHIGDFTRWKDHDAYQKAFERLLRDLKAKDARPKA